MLTIAQIFQLLDKADHANGSSVCGPSRQLAAAGLLRRERSRPTDTTNAQIELLTWLATMQMNTFGADPWHPIKTQTPEPAPRPRGRLSVEERDWLDRLPATPSYVDRGAVSRFCSLVLAIRADPLAAEDLTFVESLWAPIERYYDRKYAQDEIAQAGVNDLTIWPSSVTRAIADVLLLDGTAADPEDASRQAADHIREYRQTRSERRVRRLAEARRRLDDLQEVRSLT